MKISRSNFRRIFASLLIGISYAFLFASPYFSDEAYNVVDKLALIAIPATALTGLFFYFLSQQIWEQTAPSLRFLLLGLALIPAFASSVMRAPTSILHWMAHIVSSTSLFMIVLIQPISHLQEAIQSKGFVRLAVSWLAAMTASFFITGVWSNFYTNLYQIAFIAIFSQLASGIFFYYAIGRIKHFPKRDAPAFWTGLSLFALLAFFQVMVFILCAQFPRLFDPNFFLLEGKECILFITISLLLLPWLMLVIHKIKRTVRQNSLFQDKLLFFIRANLPGLILAILFFNLYFIIGTMLNHPRFDVDDIFFDADGFIWRYRLTTTHWQDFYWRSVHPLALLILKPTVNLISIFLNKNTHYAAIMLTAAAGAACVFLAWINLKGILKSTIPALLMASLLGISTTHLIFGSLIETYIFLALLTLLFFALIQTQNDSAPALVAVGIATMGITLTNFAQPVIALFGAKPDIKSTIKYIATVLGLVIVFTLVSNFFYRDSNPYFFVPSSFLAEQQNVRAVSLNRAKALVRAFLFNNFAAPSPLLSHKDIPFTQFRFYRAEDYTISIYETPLQSFTEWTWIIFLVIAAISFFKDFKSHDIRLTLSLMACVLFNLIFHLRYGKELFLYTPNWTYAIVLLLGISWKKLLPQRWFQICFIALLALLMYNNADLLRTIMSISSPYIR